MSESNQMERMYCTVVSTVCMTQLCPFFVVKRFWCQCLLCVFRFSFMWYFLCSGLHLSATAINHSFEQIQNETGLENNIQLAPIGNNIYSMHQ